MEAYEIQIKAIFWPPGGLMAGEGEMEVESGQFGRMMKKRFDKMTNQEIQI